MPPPAGQHWMPSNSAAVAGFPARQAGPQQIGAYMARPPAAPGVNKFGIIPAPRPPMMDPSGNVFPQPPTKPPDPPGLLNCRRLAETYLPVFITKWTAHLLV